MPVSPVALLTGALGMSGARCEELLAEPILAADPYVIPEQTVRVLGLDRGLAQQGWLRRYSCSW